MFSNKINSNYNLFSVNPALYTAKTSAPKTSAPINNDRQGDTFSFNTKANKNVSTPILSNSVYYGLSPKLILKTYLNDETINELVEKNPKIMKILNDNSVEYTVNVENVIKIINSHLTTTMAYALQLADELGVSAADKQILEQASMFHDFGKVLIPDEIINKPGRLTDEEKEIMDLHAQLGCELLSKAGINKRVLNLIKAHHNPSSNDLLANILSVADIYSALKEERCYKKPLSNTEAINILDQKAQRGEVSAEVVDALKSLVPAELCVA